MDRSIFSLETDLLVIIARKGVIVCCYDAVSVVVCVIVMLNVKKPTGNYTKEIASCWRNGFKVEK